LAPDTLIRTPSGVLSAGGVDLPSLADRFGTPLYVMDVATLRARMRRWRRAVGEEGLPFYAGKAFLCRAMAELVAEEGLGLDVVSGGELYTALLAGFPPERIAFHGNLKTDAELRLAVDSGVGQIVVDSLFELDALGELCRPRPVRQSVWLRLTPGVDTDTHAYIQTGHASSKFGFAIDDGSALRAVRAVLGEIGLQLTGYHAHIGSQLLRPEPYLESARRLLTWAEAVWQDTGFWPETLDLGGGMGVSYTDDQTALDPMTVAPKLVDLIRSETPSGLPVPRLIMEPGRSVVADAGLTLYRVGGVKHVAGPVTYVVVDGGMGDNIRPALYAARYTAAVASPPRGATEMVTVAGRYCETGDLLIEGIELPSVQSGDLLAIFTTGAYAYSMASAYNRVPRPPVVAVEDSQAQVWVERESWADLVRLDRPLGVPHAVEREAGA
jgi:diaminopimelate decarboxylase